MATFRLVRHPFFDFSKPRTPAPIGLLGLLVVDRGADRRDVRRRHSCDDLSQLDLALLRVSLGFRFRVLDLVVFGLVIWIWRIWLCILPRPAAIAFDERPPLSIIAA